MDRRVTGSIRGQGTCLGCRFSLWLGRVLKVADQYFSLELMFPSLPLSLPFSLKSISIALSGVAQWIERWPAGQRVTGSIPSLWHTPGLWARSPVGGVQEAITH